MLHVTSRIEDALACGNFGLAHRLAHVLYVHRGWRTCHCGADLSAIVACTECGDDLSPEIKRLGSGLAAFGAHTCLTRNI